ncbi:YqaA family protein [Tabrizicola caldifontis]|uniref:YqaA family protein n=1 Tax=Tabrizicola caldifontis TaxID=2528036 RepID=UPI001081DA12|nr:VTT domain-containing protein [Rhodobacter sp. YIM 73028]
MIPLAGLFLAAFLAATPVPFQSEIVFLGLQAAGWPALILVLVASSGNVLGSCLTYALGRGFGGLREHPRFPVRPAQLARAEGWFARWGLCSLLLSWAPGGDLIVFVAGLLRAPLPLVLLLLIIAKTGRYLALAWAGGTALSLV